MENNETQKVVRQILKIPFWKDSDPNKSAILILPGTQQNYRIYEGTKHWPKKGEYLWVAGTRGDPFYTRKEIFEMIDKTKRRYINNHNFENGGWANHTLDQMRWATELLKKNDKINHIILATAAYHVPRCVLTLVQTINRQSIKYVVISPIPIYYCLGPSLDSEDFYGELSRISTYQKKGDVATFKIWEEYNAWRSNIIKNSINT